jgi:hypothetical protein
MRLATTSPGSSSGERSETRGPRLLRRCSHERQGFVNPRVKPEDDAVLDGQEERSTLRWGKSEFDQHFRIEIAPSGVGLLDEVELPFPEPALEALLPLDGVLDAKMIFVPDQKVHAVLTREPWNQSLAMLVHPARQITGDSDVKGAVTARGEDVNSAALHCAKGRYRGTRVKCECGGSGMSSWVLGSRFARPRMTRKGLRTYG